MLTLWSVTLEVILNFQNIFFLRCVFFGHIRPLLSQNHSSTFMDRFWRNFVWMLISWWHNFFIKLYIYDLKYHFYVMERLCDIFTLGPSDLITTFVLVSNLFWNFSLKSLIKKFALSQKQLHSVSLIKFKFINYFIHLFHILAVNDLL